MKRILAIHDISCIGKCSLTVVSPLISSIGVEVAVLPTAILSTHTGGFKGYTFRDLTSDLDPILEHFKTLDFKLDGIYPGYLGSDLQIDKVLNYVDYFQCPLYLDPVMGDGGKLYANFKEDFPKKLLRLVEKTYFLIPNLTEACYLLGIEYKENFTLEEIKMLLIKLTDLGPSIVVLTGISLEEGSIGAYAYSKIEDKYYAYFTDRINGYYHGTGDIFSSVMIGNLIKGKSLEKSLKIAVLFTKDAIERTYKLGTDPKYGVNFEEFIPRLVGDEYENRNEDN